MYIFEAIKKEKKLIYNWKLLKMDWIKTSKILIFFRKGNFILLKNLLKYKIL